MEALRNRSNIPTFGPKAVEPQKRIIRKPLRGVDNKVRSLAVKGSFKDAIKPKIVDKENTTRAPKGEKQAFAVKEKQIIAVKEKKDAVVKEKKVDVVKEKKADVVKGKKTAPEKEKKEVLETISPQFLETLPKIEESHTSKQLPENIDNIDLEDVGNPQLVSNFVNDIYDYLRKLEVLFPIKKNHLQLQPEITGKMRSVLIDWLVQVHMRFHLLQETLYMAISILDRFLQVEYVKRTELQLIGVTAMFIASKFEEMYAPEIGDFVYITDNTYTKQDILRTERNMLRKLDFNLSKPLPLHFLRRNSKAGNVDSTIHTLAKYLMEVCLPEYEMAYVQPSILAASALLLSLKLLTDNSWSDTLKYYSNYSEDDILPVVKNICKVLLKQESAKLQAINTKYANSKLLKISTIPQLKSSIVKELSISSAS